MLKYLPDINKNIYLFTYLRGKFPKRTLGVQLSYVSTLKNGLGNKGVHGGYSQALVRRIYSR